MARYEVILWGLFAAVVIVTVFVTGAIDDVPWSRMAELVERHTIF